MNANAINSIIFFIVLIVVIVFFITVAVKRYKRKIEWYKNWAAKFGFKHQVDKRGFSSFNTLIGEFDNHKVVIHEKLVGLHNNKRTHTFVTFSPNPFDFDFSIAHENFTTKLKKKFGNTDIEFQDDEFDAMFFIEANDEAKIRKLLDYRTQQELEIIAPYLKRDLISSKSGFEYNIIGEFKKLKEIEAFEKIIGMMRFLIANK